MSIVGDIFGAFGAEDAEDKQFAASQQSLALQREMFDEAKKNYAPYLKFGGSADILTRLYGLDGQPADPSAFTASPGYQFRQQADQQAIERSAAARGGLFSGAAGKALQDRSQSLASQEFDNYVQRLFGMSQMGQNAAGGISGAGQNFANASGNILGTMGQNQANAKISQTNALGGVADAGLAGLFGGMGGFAKAGISGGGKGVLAGLLG